MRTTKPLAVFAAILISVIASAACAQPVTADLAIIHATVLSPPAAPVVDQTILIKGDRIVYVGRDASFRAARTIDASRRYVMPGMIDAHVHLSGALNFASEADYWKWVDTGLRRILADYLAHGFTSLLSVGDFWPNILQVRERIRNGTLPGPRLLISGPILAPVNGHGIGDNPGCTALPYCAEHGIARAVPDVAAAHRVVQELAAAGVDGIKVAVQAPLIPDNAGASRGAAEHIDFGALKLNRMTENFAPGVLEAIIAEAHARHLPVRAHTGTATETLTVMRAGVDALVHGPGVIDGLPSANTLAEVVTVAEKYHIPMITTVNASSYLADTWGTERFLFDGTTGIVGYLKAAKSRESTGAGLRAVREAGITLAFGLDRFVIQRPSDAARFELQLLQDYGFSRVEALATATRNAASYLNLADEIGSIAVGKRADLIIVAGNPLELADFLDRIDITIQSGKVAWSATEDLAH